MKNKHIYPGAALVFNNNDFDRRVELVKVHRVLAQYFETISVAHGIRQFNFKDENEGIATSWRQRGNFTGRARPMVEVYDAKQHDRILRDQRLRRFSSDLMQRLEQVRQLRYRTPLTEPEMALLEALETALLNHIPQPAPGVPDGLV